MKRKLKNLYLDLDFDLIDRCGQRGGQDETQHDQNFHVDDVFLPQQLYCDCEHLKETLLTRPQTVDVGCYLKAPAFIPPHVPSRRLPTEGIKYLKNFIFMKEKKIPFGSLSSGCNVRDL